jgi:creatinine deaminase
MHSGGGDIVSEHDLYMDEAVREARLGRDEGGIPIGSVLVRNGVIIGRGHNRRVQMQDPVLHAEIDCLRNAGRVGVYTGCVLYSTLMPCYLCAGAVVQFRIPVVVVGESKTFPGAEEFMLSKGVRVIDLDRADCRDLLQEFISIHPDIWDEDIGELKTK